MKFNVQAHYEGSWGMYARHVWGLSHMSTSATPPEVVQGLN